MFCSRLCVVVCLFVCSIAATVFAQTPLQVNEAATRATIENNGIIISLAINNASPHSMTARVRTELLDPQNNIQATLESDAAIQPGASTIPITLSSVTLSEPRRELFWYRLRYQIGDGVTGIIALSEILSEPFELNLTVPPKAVTGAPCRVRVRAIHPLTRQPVSGVQVHCQFTIEQDNQSPIKAEAMTDTEGSAVFEFNLPRSIKSRSGGIDAVGERKGFTASVETYMLIDNYMRVALSTDKPLYQPGQTVHLRALVFDNFLRAKPNDVWAVKISDPENTVIHRATTTTSRFGAASLDWVIPETVRLGDYIIHYQYGDDGDESDYALPLRISRYDLPNFAVNVRPDRAYYLPNQTAEVIVRGDYLFGQPLLHGHVRIVREPSRIWDFREQRWDIKEEDPQEGDLDRTGSFVAHIDLQKAQFELKQNDESRFNDIAYTAYITDATTNRTEQRRFDLRVTREPIHVYIIKPNNRPADAPLDFYVSTFYADGSPAICEVDISEMRPTVRKRGQPVARRLRTVLTNHYGVAKVNQLITARHSDDDNLSLRLTARDGHGQVASRNEEISYTLKSSFRLETDRTIYRANEPIHLRLSTDATITAAFVEVNLPHKLAQQQQVILHQGNATLTIPYQNEFQGEMTIAAYAYDSKGHLLTGERMVVYPHDRHLQLDLKMDAASYRPGDEASAALSVKTADGLAAESAIGAVAIDQAVEERVRADVGSDATDSFVRAYQHLYNDETNIAGVSLATLNRLDPMQPVSKDLDLVAEILLLWPSPYFREKTSDEYQTELSQVFNRILLAQMQSVKAALDRRYNRTGEYPRDEKQLERILNQFGIDFAAMRDLWGMPYRASFSVNEINDRMRLVSSGADKRFGTDDDFTALQADRPYFLPHGKAIDKAVADYHERTGRFIRDYSTLRRKLTTAGIDINALRDRWGQPYLFQFDINNQYYVIKIASGGPDRRYEGKDWGTDDFTIWTTKTEYFTKQQAQVATALTAYFKDHGRFPDDDAELNRALAESHISREDLRDGWGHPLYAVFKTRSRYSNRVRMFTLAPFGQPAQEKTEITPITQTISYITFRSIGKDGKPFSYDDFDLADYSQVVAERATNDVVAQAARAAYVISGSAGAIAGLVTDPQGTVVANTKVTATHKASKNAYETATDNEGHYMFKNLPAGQYDVDFEADGFKRFIMADVLVEDKNITEVSAILEIGAASEVVNIMGEVEPIQKETGSKANTVEAKSSPASPPRAGVLMKQAGALSTPRLREYFPETLVWQPSLETDEQGHASLKFKLADNITTWHLSLVASTLDGRIGTAETDVLAFQSFFIEHDPPQVLTEGDEIALPVVLRNYLDHKQTVDMDFNPAAWFTMLGPQRQRAEVKAGDAARVTFDFRATAPVKDGPQRVTAVSAEASDAIEKKVSVHPDGEEIATTASQIFGENTAFVMNIPDRTIANTTSGELKIYPNLSAHVLEAIEAIMQRPYGCAEQTISSAYPSLLALQLYEQRGNNQSPTARHALRYVQSGYEHLLNYRDEAGGFTYWGRGHIDVALTAYALQFLNTASRFISVNEDVQKKAREWLIKQQRADGSWVAYNWNDKEDPARTAMLTALVARVLTETEKHDTSEGNKKSTANNTFSQAISVSLQHSLDYLERRSEEIDEPYLIASFALAAKGAHQKERATRAINRLATLAHNEGDKSYWAIETNTPFYGWGEAGRVETTALAVQALAPNDDTSAEAQKNDHTELLSRGLIFLMRQKDRYGVWYSTQATVQALAALVAVLPKQEMHAKFIAEPAEIIVNGKCAASIILPRSDELIGPLTIDVSKYLSTGSNRIEIRRSTSAQASAQLVMSHHEPWKEATPSGKSSGESSNALRLKVTFDKTELKIGDEVICSVEAERIGFRGYGMMFAEIGLPPGADVDRASLDRAMKESGWDVNQYDVLPDHLVLYLWPKAGGTRFTFKFTPRYGMKAQTAPSVLYDYYNPEARMVVAPVRFVVR